MRKPERSVWLRHRAARRRDPAAPHILNWFYLALAATVLGFFAYYVGVELARNRMLGFPLEDPWIHLTFARNLARGWGFAYNQGQPVQGSTAPLWTLVLAFVHLFTRSAVALVWIAKLLDALFLWVAAVFACRQTSLQTGNRWAGLAAGLGIATLCHFGWAMVSGMEVSLSIALVLAGLYYYNLRARGIRAYLHWVLFALAVYTRPESLLLAGLVTIDVIIRRIAFRRRMLYWRGLLTYVVVLVPYFALNLVLVHALFPQTYVAKIGRSNLLASLLGGNRAQTALLLGKAPLVCFAGFVGHLWRGNPMIVLLAIPGVMLAVSQAVRRRGSVGFLIPLAALTYAPLLGMSAPFGAPAFQNGRYIGAPVALAVVLAAFGAEWLLGRFRNRTRLRAAEGILAALIAFNVVTTGVATVRNTAQAESSINRMQVATSKWLEQNTPQNAVIACNDVGAIGYFANRRVLDLLGLVTPEVVPFRQRQPAGQESNGAVEFIEAKKPD